MKQSLDLVYYDVPWIKGTKVRCGGAAGGCPSNRKIGSSKHQIHYMYTKYQQIFYFILTMYLYYQYAYIYQLYYCLKTDKQA